MDTRETFRQLLLLSSYLPPNHREIRNWPHNTISTKCLLELRAVIDLGANIASLFCGCTHGHKPLASNEEKRFHTDHFAENIRLLHIEICINYWNAILTEVYVPVFMALKHTESFEMLLDPRTSTAALWIVSTLTKSNIDNDKCFGAKKGV